MTRFTCVADSANICGEGLLWHPEERALYWTDINRGLVQRVLFEGGSVQTWSFDQPATALALTNDPGLLLLVLGGRIVLWSPRHGEVRRLWTVPKWPAIRCNDARISPAGTLWFGTMQNNVASDSSTVPVTMACGALHSLDRSGTMHQWDTGFSISNTVCWSPDEITLLFGDTLANAIYRYPYSVMGDRVQTALRTTFCAGFERGLPDGSATDEDGFLWNCRYAGGCVVRFAPDGSIDRVVDTPVPNPTTCAFGGPEMRTLYITSALQQPSINVQYDGGLFCIEAPSTGLPLPRFSLPRTIPS